MHKPRHRELIGRGATFLAPEVFRLVGSNHMLTGGYDLGIRAVPTLLNGYRIIIFKAMRETYPESMLDPAAASL